MKNIFLNKIIAVLAAILLFTACSKDNKTERTLEKVKTWNIERIDYQKAQAGWAGTNAKIGTENNAGTMTFESNGTGSYDYVLDGFHRKGTYKWSVVGGNVSFNYAAASLNGAHAATYNIIYQTKSSVKLQGDEAFVDSIGSYALNAIFHLKK